MKWLWGNKFFTITAVILASLFSINLQAEEIDPTDISYVSVNPYTNEITVSWYKSESPNIEKTRILYIYDETTLIKGKGIVDIPGNEDKTFVFQTDTISQISFEANERPISIAVDAYAENGDNSTSLREYHTTMVASAQTTTCPTRIKLTWTKYYGFGITVDKYEIVESINGKETVIKECASNEQTCLIELNENAERNFFVRATFKDCRGNQRTSTSCMCEVAEKAPIMPQFISNENISIDNDKDISLIFKYDLASDFRHYIIYKSRIDTNHFAGIDTITLQPTSSDIYKYTDKNAYHSDTVVYYKTAAFDNCNEKIIESRPFTYITLTLTGSDELTSDMEWTKITPWLSLYQYRIWRSQNSEDEQVIDSVEGFNYQYSDNIENEFSHISSLCYRVEAVQKEGKSSYQSFSNSVCLNKSYKLLIPNAINPYSNIAENRIFKPKYAFVTGDYKMEIFDRFGGCIFTSSNIDTGWDGTAKGSIAPTGAYQYKIVIKQPNGEKIERLGVVNLIYR